LCYQICFEDYDPDAIDQDDPVVQIDTSLFDSAGELNWDALEAKTQNLIQRLLANLPTES
jgi:hypothetical protein